MCDNMRKDTTLLGTIMFPISVLRYSHLKTNRAIICVSLTQCLTTRVRQNLWGFRYKSWDEWTVSKFQTVPLEMAPGVAQWLRRCATSRTVPGSIPGGQWIFQWHIPSDRTMALGSTQPLVKMILGTFPGVKVADAWGWPYHLHVPNVMKSGRHENPLPYPFTPRNIAVILPGNWLYCNNLHALPTAPFVFLSVNVLRGGGLLAIWHIIYEVSPRKKSWQTIR
jgi:hypothetical protein